MKILSISVRNYRTLQNFDLSLSDGYNAVCGKNNSGKSNLVKAIRLLFGEKTDRFPFEEDIDFSYKTDFCGWKKASESKEKISISGVISVSRSVDQGLLEFLESIDSAKTKLAKSKAEFEIKISIEANPDSTKLQLTELAIDGNEISDKVVSQSVYDKLKNSVVFHNSTMTHRIYFSRRRRLHGIFSKIPEGTKVNVDKKSRALKTEINKVFKSHAKDLQEMLGRLGDKLEVKLDTPEFDFDEYPYGISLGYRDFNIPLDDWGSGTRNQTLIVKAIFEAYSSRKASNISDRVTPVVLIEEPESFLHPLAQAEFSEVLQSLASEWSIQVIASTHSPYMLSHKNPESNILLDRQKDKTTKMLSETKLVSVGGDDWKKPFEHTLGVCGPEFDIFKTAIFSQSDILIMVEGETDKEYFELCRDKKHGKNALTEKGQIFAYDGKDKISNGVLLKFIRDRYLKVIITSDLDAENDVFSKLQRLGFEKNKTYFPVGIDAPGKRAIEGLLPEAIRIKVRSENQDLVTALESNNSNERRNAKNELKKKYLENFKTEASVDAGDYAELYKICKKLNQACKSEK